MLNCPVCSTGMTEVDKAGVTIDTCPKCRGVWLDRGELEKLGERLARDGDSQPYNAGRGEDIRSSAYRRDDRRRYDDDDDDHRYGHKKSGMRRFMDFFD